MILENITQSISLFSTWFACPVMHRNSSFVSRNKRTNLVEILQVSNEAHPHSHSKNQMSFVSVRGKKHHQGVSCRLPQGSIWYSTTIPLNARRIWWRHSSFICSFLFVHHRHTAVRWLLSQGISGKSFSLRRIWPNMNQCQDKCWINTRVHKYDPDHWISNFCSQNLSQIPDGPQSPC